jgi:hypothetical protein
MANPNIVATGWIQGRTDVLKVSYFVTWADAVVNSTALALSRITSNPSGSGCVYKVNLLQASNVNGAAPYDVSAGLYRGGTVYSIATVVAVPADGSLVIIGKENPIYLLEGDSIVMIGEPVAGQTGEDAVSLHAICSYELISQSEPA